MERRTFLGTVAGSLLAAPLAAEAQQAGKVYRVGVLLEGPPPTLEERSRSPFRNALKELGWIDGQNIAFEDRRSVPIERLTDRATEMVRLKVDVFYTVGVDAARAALQASPAIPIVLSTALDPVEFGLAVTLSRPGGNVTGVTAINLETAGKRLELLKEIVPRLTRVAALWNAGSPGGARPITGAMQLGSTTGVRIQSLPVRGPEEFDRAFADMRAERADALWIFADIMLFANRLRLAELALKHHLPTVATGRDFAKAGILAVYGPDLTELNQRAAAHVDKILKGAKPADLPFEQSTRFDLVVNLKTAKALGLTIPPSLLQRADQVIE